MTAIKTASLEQLQLVGRFETFCRLLSAERYARHRERPLAYWALPSDRRLPLAFLGRTLRDILHTPYAELAATPGIGRKKMRSLMNLLDRAARTDAADLPTDISPATEERHPVAVHDCKGNGFDASAVSELVWDQWRASVVRHGFGKESLGRLAPSLRDISRVIWNTPLDRYADKTLADIRAMKTHGDKRVGAILEVFYGIHAVIAQVGPQNHLAVRLSPRRIDAAESWLRAALQRPGVPSGEEIFTCFIEPLVEQLRCDASPQIVQLAESRVGMRGPVATVREAAGGFGLTRARIYQLLGEIQAIMSVRWPLGHYLVYELRDKIERECEGGVRGADFEPFRAAVELFFPTPRRSPLTRTEDGANNRSGSPGRDSSEVHGGAKIRRRAFARPMLPR